MARLGTNSGGDSSPILRQNHFPCMVIRRRPLTNDYAAPAAPRHRSRLARPHPRCQGKPLGGRAGRPIRLTMQGRRGRHPSSTAALASRLRATLLSESPASAILSTKAAFWGLPCRQFRIRPGVQRRRRSPVLPFFYDKWFRVEVSGIETSRTPGLDWSPARQHPTVRQPDAVRCCATIIRAGATCDYLSRTPSLRAYPCWGRSPARRGTPWPAIQTQTGCGRGE